MRTKRLLQSGMAALLMLFLFTCGLCAATTDGDEHASAAMKMIERLQGGDPKKGLPMTHQKVIIKMLQDINKQILTPESASSADVLVLAYINDGGGRQFLNHVMAKQLAAEASTDEIDSVLALMDTEEWRLFEEHSNAAASDTSEMMTDVMTMVMGAMFSTEVECVKYRCPKAYVKKYQEFYDNAPVKYMFDGMQQAMANVPAKPDEKKAAESFNKMLGTLQFNLPAICANASYGVLTEADLDLGIKFYNMPACKKFYSALFNDLNKIVDMVMQEKTYLMQSYTQWLTEEIAKSKGSGKSSAAK